MHKLKQWLSCGGKALAAAASFTLCVGSAWATSYKWVGGGSDADWRTVDNWRTYDSDAGTWSIKPSSYPTGSDTAIFDGTAEVLLSHNNDNVNTLQIESTATVTFKNSSGTAGTGTLCMSTSTKNTDGGYGKIILAGATLRSQGSDVTIANEIEIKDGTSSQLLGGSGSYPMTLTGKMTGSGKVTFSQANTTAYTCGVYLSGDMADFAGEIVMTALSKQGRHLILNSTSAAYSPNSKWTMFSENYCPALEQKSTGYCTFRAGDNATYTFGSLNGRIGSYYRNDSDYVNNTSSIINVGSLNENCSLSGNWHWAEDDSSKTATTFNWTASSATLTYAVTNTATMNVTAGGTVKFPTARSIPATLNFTAGGGTVLLYDSSLVSTLATALSGSTYKPTVKYYGTIDMEAGDTLAYPLESGATVNITLTDSTKSGDTLLTLADSSVSGVTFNLLSPNTGAASKFFAADTSTSGSITARYVSGVYIWNGTDGDEWGTAADWLKVASDGTTSTATSAPDTNTTVIIPNDATIKGGKYNVRNILLLGDLTYTYSGNSSYGNNNLNINGIVEGSGKFIMTGANIRSADSGPIYFYSELKLAADTVFFIHSSKYAYFYGKISGSGNITFNDSNNSTSTYGAYITFAGDMSEYTGTITTPTSSSSSNNSTTFANDNSYICFSNSTFNCGGTVVINRNKSSQPLCALAGTYTFSSLSGNVYSDSSSDVTIVTGEGDTENKTITHAFASGSSTNWKLTKKGSCQLTIESNNFAEYVLCAGTLVLPAEATVKDSSGNTVVGSESDGTYTYALNYAVTDSNGDTIYYTSAADAISAGCTAISCAVSLDESYTIPSGVTVTYTAPFTGALTLNGGTLEFGTSYAGDVSGTIAVSAASTINYNQTGSIVKHTGVITGSGDLTIDFGTKGAGYASTTSSTYSGTMTIASNNSQTSAIGLMTPATTAGIPSLTLNSSVTSVSRVFDFECSSATTFNFDSLTIESQYTGVYLKSPTTIALGANGGDSVLNGAFGMQNSTDYAITKSGSGKLSIGANFQMKDVTTLFGTGSYSGNSYTRTLTVNAGTLEVDGSDVLSDFTVTLASGVEVTKGFSASTIIDNGATAPEGYSISITGTADEGQTLSLTWTGLDPDDGRLSVDVSYDNTKGLTGDELTAAVVDAVYIASPDGVTIDTSTYKSYFTYTVTEKSTGVYTLEITGLDQDEVVTPVDKSALDGLLTGTAGGTATVTVKPGLYYGFTTGTSTSLDTPELSLATGDTMTYTMPSGDNTLIAVKVRISATPDNQ